MYIYTRFNPIQSCLVAGTVDNRMKVRRFDDSWLRQRLVLFERHTYTSIMSQTDQDFEWVGLVHRDSPDWFVEAFDKFPRIRIELVEKDTDVGNPGDVTVNLDSDDAIARRFVESVRVHLDHRVLYYLNGLKVSEDRYIRCASDSNPFNVVPAGELTVLDRDHGSWPEAQKIDHLNPMWLQVIHGDNISNRFRLDRQWKGYGTCKKLNRRTQVSPFFELGKA